MTDPTDPLKSLLIECDSELSAIAHGRPPSDFYALHSLYTRVRKTYEAMQRDNDHAIDVDWLVSKGFSVRSLFATILLPPVHDGAAIVELYLSQECDWWEASLCQGVPDDQHVPDDHVSITSLRLRTRGQVRRLVASLGGPEL
jgi:hypothetical protein